MPRSRGSATRMHGSARRSSRCCNKRCARAAGSTAMIGATPDLDAFAALLRARGLSEPGVPISVSRAPGRLDVMGGIADYSGSLVLERPIAEATWAAIQPTSHPVLDVVSLGRPPLTIPLQTVAPDGVPIAYDQARRMFRDGETWAAYVVGVLLVLAREIGRAHV